MSDDLLPENTKIEYKEQPKESWFSKRPPAAVTVTHVPSGITVTKDCGDTTEKNKDLAIEELSLRLSTFNKTRTVVPTEETFDFYLSVDEEAEVATALDVLAAYPGRDASKSKLDVWEAMRDSVLGTKKEKHA